MVVDNLHDPRRFNALDRLRGNVVVDEDNIFAGNIFNHGRRGNVKIFQDKIAFLVKFARNARLAIEVHLLFVIGVGNRAANGIAVGADVPDNVSRLANFLDLLDKSGANIINGNFAFADGQGGKCQNHSDDKAPHSQEKFKCSHQSSPPPPLIDFPTPQSLAGVPCIFSRPIDKLFLNRKYFCRQCREFL